MDNLMVYYGYSKLTKKAIRKPELAIYYENAYTWKNEAWIEKRMTVIHTRKQTKEEMMDSDINNRMFTKYSYYIDEKPFFGNIDKVLNQNFLVEKNHISELKREELRTKLRKAYFTAYDRDENNLQTLIKF